MVVRDLVARPRVRALPLGLWSFWFGRRAATHSTFLRLIDHSSIDTHPHMTMRFAWHNIVQTIQHRGPWVCACALVLNSTWAYTWFLLTFNLTWLDITLGCTTITLVWLTLLEFYGRSVDWIPLQRYRNLRHAHDQLTRIKLMQYDASEDAKMVRISDVEYCRHCQRHVCNLDHHCFLLGTCVGRHNHLQFVMLMLGFLVGTVIFLMHTLLYYLRHLMPAIPWHAHVDLIIVHVAAFVMFHKAMVVSWLCALLTIVMTNMLVRDQCRLIALGLTVRLEFRLLTGACRDDGLLDYIMDDQRVNTFSWMNRWVNVWKRQSNLVDTDDQVDTDDPVHNLAMIIFDECEPDVEEMMMRWFHALKDQPHVEAQ